MDTISKFLEQVGAIARNGLTFTESGYDKARFEQILELCSQRYAEVLDVDQEQIRNYFLQNSHYQTPKLGVNGLVVDDKGRILLEQRRDDKCWGLPGGWAECGEIPEEIVVRELKEETGYDVEVQQMIKLQHRLPGDWPVAFTSYHVLYQCRITGGKLTLSHESLDLAFHHPDEVSNWHIDHGEWVKEFLGG